MPQAAVWQSRPVFITSTFRDMHAERDYLHSHIFPELAERLKDRFHYLEPIDLRWGVETVSVDEQTSKELLVLKVCLAEIERSRPFLIALLGDRYGWVPPPQRLESAAAEAGHRGDLTGRSVTALEIEFGVLDSFDQRRRSRFYVREPLPYDRMPPEAAARYSDLCSIEPGAHEGHQRLQALKARIERDLPGRVRHYQARWDGDCGMVTGLEDWGRQVLDDLWHDLEEETRAFAAAVPTTWQEQEARVLEQFAATACREFVGREALLTELTQHATGPTAEGAGWGVCITGTARSGKSALFAELYRRLRKEDALVLSHAAGISIRSTQVDAILRRWTAELAAHLSISDPAALLKEPAEVEKAFAELLSCAAVDRRVVCLIDALNYFEPSPAERHFSWLPELWPRNVRLIATAIPGAESEALSERRGVRITPLPPLDRVETGQIAETVCRRYRKSLHPDVLEILTGKRLPNEDAAAGIPLWLELALEELLSLDEDDFHRAEREFAGTAEQKLHTLLLAAARELPPVVEALYGYLLARLEQAHGAELVRTFATLLAMSRSGWRSADLLVLLAGVLGATPDELRLAALRRGFRAHLVQRGALAQWDFFHAQTRVAVESRYFTEHLIFRRCRDFVKYYLCTLTIEDPVLSFEGAILCGVNKWVVDRRSSEAERLLSSVRGAEVIVSVLNRIREEWSRLSQFKDWLGNLAQVELEEARAHARCADAELNSRIMQSTGELTIHWAACRVCIADLYLWVREPKLALEQYVGVLELWPREVYSDNSPGGVVISSECLRALLELAWILGTLTDLWCDIGNTGLSLQGPRNRMDSRNATVSSLSVGEDNSSAAFDSDRERRYFEILSHCRSMVGELWVRLGEPARAREQYEQAMALSEELRRRAPTAPSTPATS